MFVYCPMPSTGLVTEATAGGLFTTLLSGPTTGPLPTDAITKGSFGLGYALRTFGSLFQLLPGLSEQQHGSNGSISLKRAPYQTKITRNTAARAYDCLRDTLQLGTVIFDTMRHRRM